MGNSINQKIYLLIEKIYLLIAVASLAFVIGWLTGSSGPNETVLAAIIPVVLTLAGTAFVFKVPLHKDKPQQYLASSLVLFFVIFLYFGVQTGEHQRIVKERNLKADLVKVNIEFLKQCMKDEIYINSIRRELELEPLPSTTFCRLSSQ